MPTVLRLHGFRIAVFPPPREHLPPHVHVFNAKGEVVVHLAVPGRSQLVRRVVGMSQSDVAKAERIVAAHASLLLEHWNDIWGEGQ